MKIIIVRCCRSRALAENNILAGRVKYYFKKIKLMRYLPDLNV